MNTDPQQERLMLETERFRIVHLENPRGRPELSRTVIRHPGAVVIVPLVQNQQICLIRNYRVSIGQTLVELPAGTCEPGEPLDETARRELLEETGFTAQHFEHLHSFYASPGILDEQMHLFVATDLASGSAQRMEDEQIENLIVPLDEAYTMVRQKQIIDGKSIAGLLWYRLLQG